MNMCDDCGFVFEEPKAIYEVHNELEDCPVETFYECPICGGPFSEAVRCDCGEWTKDLEFKLCGECKKLVVERFHAFKAGLTEEEQDYLNAYLEG